MNVDAENDHLVLKLDWFCEMIRAIKLLSDTQFPDGTQYPLLRILFDERITTSDWSLYRTLYWYPINILSISY